MTEVSEAPMMSPLGPATPMANGFNSPAALSRVVSLPVSPHESRSPTLHRPASSLPTIAPVFSRSQGLDAAMKKLQAGLSTRTGEYCKRVLASTVQLQQQWMTRLSKKPNTPTASNDILEFGGVPYTSPVEPDLPVSPSNNNNNAASPSQSSTIASPSVLSPSRTQSGPFLSPSSAPPFAATNSYITDLCVHHKLNKKSQPPDGYTLLDRTVSGLYRAQVNRNNNSTKVHIGYKRSNSSAKAATTKAAPAAAPITSVSVFFRDLKEEAPFNFVAVERNTAGGDGCLHPASPSRQPYLAFSRGEGAPLTHISLISRQHKEALPAGWHEVKVTLSGDKKADISGGNSEGAVYVCFRVDVRPIMHKWRQALHDFEQQRTPKSHVGNTSSSPSTLSSPTSSTPEPDEDEQQLFPYYVRLFALLSSLLYSYDSKLILFAFDVYRKLQPQHIPPPLLNLYLSCVCDATPLFLTYFQSSQHSSLLKWLMSVFSVSLPVLSVDVLVKCVEVCLLLRHEDKQLEVSEAMITRVLEAVTDIHTCCSCQSKAAAEGAVDGDDYKDSGGNTPAVPQSPSSNNSSAAAFFGSTSQMCYHCATKHYRALQPITQLSESIIRQLAANIAAQHALSSHVRSYRRHHNITPHFRSDVRDIIARLITLDEPAMRQRKAVQGMLGGMGLGTAGGEGEGGRGKFSFSSVRAGEIAAEVKEETEEGVRVEEASPSAGRTADTSRNHTPPPAAGNIVINLDTPSKLPSQDNNTTLVNDANSRTPSPTETKDERELNGASFLLPPDRGGHGEEETSMSYSGSGSGSEFLYPEFHEDEALTPTPVQEMDEEEDEDADEETKEAAADGDSEPGSSSVDGTTPQAPSSSAAADEHDGHTDAGQFNHNKAAGNGTQSIASPTALNASSAASSTPSSPVSTASPHHPPVFAFPALNAATAESELSPRRAEMHLFALVLTYCKAATEHAQFGLRDSETLRRKQHALRLLLNVLHHSHYYFRTHLSSSLLLRRFVMTSLMTASVTDNMPIFRLVLQAFSLVSERYKSEVMIELGTVLDLVFLGFLSTPYIVPQQKTAIVEVLLLSMLKSASSVINLYYNYDNNARSWVVFQRLVDVLASIVEGGESNSGAGHSGAAVVAAASSGEGELDENGDKVGAGLQRQALKLLVHLLHMQAQWIGVPGLNRPADGPSRLLQPNLTLADRASHLAPPVPYRGGRRPSWSSRFEDQKQQAETLKKAIRLAQTDSLKSALGFYRLANPANAHPMELAKFLYRNDSLDKVEVGDLLSGTTDRFMKHEQYDELRRCYISLLDFTGLTLDQALRTFLSDSGFRLPGEAQKIDRLLSAFSEAYVKDNPNSVSDPDSAYTLTFALVMLNTDAHNPNLDQKKSNNRKRMTEDEFCRNLRGMNGGSDFDREYLLQMYQAIVHHEIKMLDQNAKPQQSASSKRSLDDADRSAVEHKALIRKSYEVPVRKALAYCKTHVCDTHTFMQTDDANIVRGMYDACWYRALKALETRSDHAGSDVELLHICLDGIAYGAIIGILLGMNEQRDAYTKQLAKVCFIEKCNQDPSKRHEVSARLAKEEHLKQEWYRRAGYDAQHHPTEACKSVFTQLNSVKHTIHIERQQATLKRVEADFGGEIVLADPHRALVKEGPLIKVSNDGRKRTTYHFMLFSDLILYASQSGSASAGRYKVHRVVHLSLCRLEDVRSTVYPHAFRIVSPQKSFLVLADSADKKQRWLDAILANLREVMEKRKKYIEEARKKEDADDKSSAPAPLPPTPPTPASRQSNGTAASSSSASSSAASSPTSPSRRDMLRVSSSMDFNQGREGTLRRYSTFIGQSDLDLNARLNPAAADPQSVRSVTHCKLCIRPFNTLFKRKQRCKWCQDIICQDCCKNKAKLPGTGGKVAQVCDACFGALSGMVGEDVQLLTIKEEHGLSAAAGAPSQPPPAVGGREKSAATLERERREERRRTT